MRILLVEDEEGIREGLASLLRLSGHVVVGAGSVAEGLRSLEAEAPDLVITDWRLGDGDAGAILGAWDGVVLVTSGYPAEVERREGVEVLVKPVSPDDLLDRVAGIAGRIEGERSGAPAADPLAGLPADTRARVRLAIALAGGGEASVCDDGEIVTVRAALRTEDGLADLERLGGDVRVLCGEGGRRVELRLYRDGRPDGPCMVVGPADPWPEAGRVAIDLSSGPEPDPRAFVDLVGRARAAGGRGREVLLLNVPDHLRLYLEVLGREAELPKRPVSGPRLPEVLAQLWSVDPVT